MTTTGELANGEFSHEALFYRDEKACVDAFRAFAMEGIDNDEPVALALPTDKLTAVERALGDAAAGVEFVDMTAVGRNPGGFISRVLRPFTDGHPGRVRVAGEPVRPERSAAEYAAAIEHEALLNEAFADTAGVFLCAYDASRLGRAVLDDVVATHPETVDEMGLHCSDTYDPVAVLDSCNKPLPVPAAAEACAFDLGRLPEARHFAVAHAECQGMARDRIEDIALVVGELAANSVQHGGGSGWLQVWREPATGAFVCQVDDAGDHVDRLAGRVPAAPDQLGGRGLLLVNGLADLVRTYRGAGHTATRVWFDR